MAGKKTPKSSESKREQTTSSKPASRQKSTKTKESVEAAGDSLEINEEDYIPVEKKAEIGKCIPCL